MRLTSAEKEGLIKAVGACIPKNFCGALVLFGSQVNDLARGGDIDLVLIVESANDLQNLKMNDYKIVAAMKSSTLFNDRKIDFQIISLDESKAGFYAQALAHGKSVVLQRWGS